MTLTLRKKLTLIFCMITVMLLASCTSGELQKTEDGTILPADNDLTVYFLDVGQADSTLLVSEGEAVLIDAGNRDDRDFLVDYLQKLGIDELKYIVFTHPHEDHIGSGEAIIDNINVGKIFMLDEYDDGIEGYLSRAIDKAGIATEKPHSEEIVKFGECEMEFFVPDKDYKSANDDSLWVKVKHGRNSMLFTGDAGHVPETAMIDAGFDLETDLLQAGHHGSRESNSYYLLRESNPKYVVISCGVDNMYGHPHEEALSRFNDLGAEVFRTDEQGTIVAVCDGNNITFNCEGKKPSRPHTANPEEAKYIGNINTKKYHNPNCGGLPKEENRVYFMSTDAAEKAGYNPCGNCNPK